jgi:hypothetical protein
VVRNVTFRSPPSLVIEKDLFIGTTSGSCAFEQTSQQYLVNAYYPNGRHTFRLVNFEQLGGLDYAYHKMQTVCAYGNLRCEGGTDTQSILDFEHPLIPPLIIGAP